MKLPSTNTRPILPKRMAARLRAVYAKVDDTRGYVAFAEAKILDCMMHLQEYEDDPAMFALLHYPSTSGVNSYPVQTNIARTRDEIERKTERIPIYVQAVVDAEQAMASAEIEVSEALASLRPNTPGRVAWPQDPRSLEDYRKENLARFKREREVSRRSILRAHEKHQKEIARQKVEDEAYQRETEQLVEEALAAMPKEKSAVYRGVFEALKRAMSSGQFGVQEIVALANGDHEAFAPILESAKRLLADKQE